MDSEFGLAIAKPEGKTINLETGEVSDTIPGDIQDDGVRWIELRYDPQEIPSDIEFIADDIATDIEHRLKGYCLGDDDKYSVMVALVNRMIKEGSGL